VVVIIHLFQLGLDRYDLEAATFLSAKVEYIAISMVIPKQLK
jgi:hypothetical protein